VRRQPKNGKITLQTPQTCRLSTLWYWQSPVHENGVRHAEVESEKSTSYRAKIYRGGGARHSHLLPSKPVRKFGYSRENLYGCKLLGLQWKLENLEVTGTPVKTWKQESSNFLTGFHESKRESRAPPPLYIFALPLYGGGFVTFTSVWRTPFSWTGLHTVEGTVCEKLWTCSEQVLRKWFWTGFEQSLNAAASQSRQRRLFFGDNVIARRTRCLRDFSAFFYLTSEHQKWGVHVTFVWWWVFLRPCERVCLWINVYLFKYQKTQSPLSRDIKKFDFNQEISEKKRQRKKEREHERASASEKKKERERKKESESRCTYHPL